MPKNSPFFIDLGQGLSMMIGLPTIAFWDNAGRPKKARKGTLGFNFQTKSLEYWDGNSWFSAPMSVD
jgi:hypothetical protein